MQTLFFERPPYYKALFYTSAFVSRVTMYLYASWSHDEALMCVRQLLLSPPNPLSYWQPLAV